MPENNGNSSFPTADELFRNLADIKFPSIEDLLSDVLNLPVKPVETEHGDYVLDRFNFRLSRSNPVDVFLARKMIEDMDDGVNMSALVKTILFVYYSNRQSKQG